MMDAVHVSPVALLGSASGSVPSSPSDWATPRRKDRGQHMTKAITQRRKLFKNFIEEAPTEARRES
jgi:hypothetical protein